MTWELFSLPSPSACPTRPQFHWLHARKVGFSTLVGIKCEKSLTKSVTPLYFIAGVRVLLWYYVTTRHLQPVAHAKWVSIRSTLSLCVTVKGTQGRTEQGRSKHLDRRVWCIKETKLIRLLVSWTSLVLWICYMLGVHPCNFDVHWFKGLHVISHRI